jgi:hypothetical protein
MCREASAALGSGAWPLWNHTAVCEQISRQRSGVPYQLLTMIDCQGVVASVSTWARLGRRLPFLRGRPLVPGWRGGAGL